MNTSGETKTGAPVIEPEAVSNASFRRTIVAVPSDTQCGSVYGLMPAGEWSLAEGGSYIPNELQDLIWKQWVECWGVVRALRDEVPNTRLIVAHNGDAVEGFHHGTTEIVSLSVGEHERIHLAVMDSALEIAGYDGEAVDLLYYVAGWEPYPPSRRVLVGTGGTYGKSCACGSMVLYSTLPIRGQ